MVELAYPPVSELAQLLSSKDMLYERRGSKPLRGTQGVKMKVDIEDIDELNRKRKEFNDIPIEDIEFYEKGVKIDIPKEVIDEWRFIGLINTDFVQDRYWEYKRKPSEERCIKMLEFVKNL